MTEPTDKEVEAFAVEEQFLLFCDVDEFTQIARAVLAKWGTPPAVEGEPVAWLSTDCIGERYLCFTKPKDSNPARPLVFGDTTQQPAAKVDWIGASSHHLMQKPDCGGESCDCRSYCKKVGGQHGTK